MLGALEHEHHFLDCINNDLPIRVNGHKHPYLLIIIIGATLGDVLVVLRLLALPVAELEVGDGPVLVVVLDDLQRLLGLSHIKQHHLPPLIANYHILGPGGMHINGRNGVPDELLALLSECLVVVLCLPVKHHQGAVRAAYEYQVVTDRDAGGLGIAVHLLRYQVVGNLLHDREVAHQSQGHLLYLHVLQRNDGVLLKLLPGHLLVPPLVPVDHADLVLVLPVLVLLLLQQLGCLPLQVGRGTLSQRLVMHVLVVVQDEVVLREMPLVIDLLVQLHLMHQAHLHLGYQLLLQHGLHRVVLILDVRLVR